MWLAWLCRSLWSVTPHFFRNLDTAGHTPRLGRRAVCQGNDMPAIVYADTKLEQFFAQLSAPTAQFLNCR
jgi:hypothetical protein